MGISRHMRMVWLHLSFWCVYLSFDLFQFSVFQRRFENYTWHHGLTISAIQMACTVAVAYLNYFYFLPRFLRTKNWITYVISFSVPFAAFIVLRVYLTRYLLDAYELHGRFFDSPRFVMHVIAGTLFIAVFISLLRFAGDWFEMEGKKKEIENEKLTAELNFLKAQINPHFLFNTLNNLYYLAYKTSPHTTEVIAKLSEVMRYMLYDANHERVLLTKEIAYMENYISLERLRLNNAIPIDFTVTGNIEGKHIAPLILITFLENAFKHGVSNTNKDAWVKISIHVNDGSCEYYVSNSVSQKRHDEAGEKSGIGLQNVRRRLELVYPENHLLKIEQDDKEYNVTLHLPLDK